MLVKGRVDPRLAMMAVIISMETTALATSTL
jgi:hypothetical protein